MFMSLHKNLHMDVHNSSIHTFKTFSKGSSIGEWINKWQHIHYKEYNSAIKICLLVNVKGMNYNSIMPSKRRQTRKATQCTIPCSRKGKITGLEHRAVMVGRDARVGSGRKGGNYKAIRETYWDDLHFLKKLVSVHDLEFKLEHPFIYKSIS